MIVCHRCGKENQDHYKFCLGCGAELSGTPKAGGGEVGMMKTMMADVGGSPTPPGGAPSQHPGQYGDPMASGRVPGAPMAPPPGPPGRVLPPNARPGLPGTPTGLPSNPPPIPPRPGPRPAGPPPGVPTASRAAVSPPPVEAPPTGSRPGVGNWGSPGPADIPLPTPGSPELAAQTAADGPRVCPSCNATVPPAFKFCGVCGCKIPEQPAPAPQPIIQQQPVTAHMTLIRPDGNEGGTHQLAAGENTIGRSHGDLFQNDSYLSPTHATLIVERGRALIRDLDSLNGVFVKMTEEEELQPGQIIRIGQELLRFDLIEPPGPHDDGTEVMGSPNPGYWGKITVVIGSGVDGSAYPLLGDSVTLGRERGEINFPDDGYVSGLHARLSNQNGKFVLADLGSSNGTFIKVTKERELQHESFVLLGQQLFRLSLQ